MLGVEFIAGGIFGSVVTAAMFIVGEEEPDVEVYHHE